MADHTPYQRKIIKRYYQNFDAIQFQKLSEKVTELYLADGRRRDAIWKQVGEVLAKLEFPASRIEHLLARRDPALLPGILKELEGRAD